MSSKNVRVSARVSFTGLIPPVSSLLLPSPHSDLLMVTSSLTLYCHRALLLPLLPTLAPLLCPSCPPHDPLVLLLPLTPASTLQGALHHLYLEEDPGPLARVLGLVQGQDGDNSQDGDITDNAQDVDDIKEQIDLNDITEQIDVNDITEQIDVNDITEQIDVEDITEQIDVDDITEQEDVDGIIEQIDVDDNTEQSNVYINGKECETDSKTIENVPSKKSFYCDMCKFRSKYKFNLKRHILKDHSYQEMSSGTKEPTSLDDITEDYEGKVKSENLLEKDNNYESGQSTKGISLLGSCIKKQIKRKQHNSTGINRATKYEGDDEDILDYFVKEEMTPQKNTSFHSQESTSIEHFPSSSSSVRMTVPNFRFLKSRTSNEDNPGELIMEEKHRFTKIGQSKYKDTLYYGCHCRHTILCPAKVWLRHQACNDEDNQEEQRWMVERTIGKHTHPVQQASMLANSIVMRMQRKSLEFPNHSAPKIRKETMLDIVQELDNSEDLLKEIIVEMGSDENIERKIQRFRGKMHGQPNQNRDDLDVNNEEDHDVLNNKNTLDISKNREEVVEFVVKGISDSGNDIDREMTEPIEGIASRCSKEQIITADDQTLRDIRQKIKNEIRDDQDFLTNKTNTPQNHTSTSQEDDSFAISSSNFPPPGVTLLPPLPSSSPLAGHTLEISPSRRVRSSRKCQVNSFSLIVDRQYVFGMSKKDDRGRFYLRCGEKGCSASLVLRIVDGKFEVEKVTDTGHTHPPREDRALAHLARARLGLELATRRSELLSPSAPQSFRSSLVPPEGLRSLHARVVEDLARELPPASQQLLAEVFPFSKKTELMMHRMLESLESPEEREAANRKWRQRKARRKMEGEEEAVASKKIEFLTSPGLRMDSGLLTMIVDRKFLFRSEVNKTTNRIHMFCSERSKKRGMCGVYMDITNS